MSEHLYPENNQQASATRRGRFNNYGRNQMRSTSTSQSSYTRSTPPQSNVGIEYPYHAEGHQMRSLSTRQNFYLRSTPPTPNIGIDYPYHAEGHEITNIPTYQYFHRKSSDAQSNEEMRYSYRFEPYQVTSIPMSQSSYTMDSQLPLNIRMGNLHDSGRNQVTNIPTGQNFSTMGSQLPLNIRMGNLLNNGRNQATAASINQCSYTMSPQPSPNLGIYSHDAGDNQVANTLISQDLYCTHEQPYGERNYFYGPESYQLTSTSTSQPPYTTTSQPLPNISTIYFHDAKDKQLTGTSTNQRPYRTTSQSLSNISAIYSRGAGEKQLTSTSTSHHHYSMTSHSLPTISTMYSHDTGEKQLTSTSTSQHAYTMSSQPLPNIIAICSHDAEDKQKLRSTSTSQPPYTMISQSPPNISPVYCHDAGDKQITSILRKNGHIMNSQLPLNVGMSDLDENGGNLIGDSSTNQSSCTISYQQPSDVEIIYSYAGDNQVQDIMLLNTDTECKIYSFGDETSKLLYDKVSFPTCTDTLKVETFPEINFDVDSELERIDQERKNEANRKFDELIEDLRATTPTFDEMCKCGDADSTTLSFYPVAEPEDISATELYNNLNASTNNLPQGKELYYERFQKVDELKSSSEEAENEKRQRRGRKCTNNLSLLLEESIACQQFGQKRGYIPYSENGVTTMDNNDTDKSKHRAIEMQRKRYTHMNLRQLHKVKLGVESEEIENTGAKKSKRGRKTKMKKEERGKQGIFPHKSVDEHFTKPSCLEKEALKSSMCKSTKPLAVDCYSAENKNMDSSRSSPLYSCLSSNEHSYGEESCEKVRNSIYVASLSPILDHDYSHTWWVKQDGIKLQRRYLTAKKDITFHNVQTKEKEGCNVSTSLPRGTVVRLPIKGFITKSSDSIKMKEKSNASGELTEFFSPSSSATCTKKTLHSLTNTNENNASEWFPKPFISLSNINLARTKNAEVKHIPNRIKQIEKLNSKETKTEIRNTDEFIYSKSFGCQNNTIHTRTQSIRNIPNLVISKKHSEKMCVFDTNTLEQHQQPSDHLANIGSKRRVNNNAKGILATTEEKLPCEGLVTPDTTLLSEKSMSEQISRRRELPRKCRNEKSSTLCTEPSNRHLYLSSCRSQSRKPSQSCLNSPLQSFKDHRSSQLDKSSTSQCDAVLSLASFSSDCSQSSDSSYDPYEYSDSSNSETEKRKRKRKKSYSRDKKKLNNKTKQSDSMPRNPKVPHNHYRIKQNEEEQNRDDAFQYHSYQKHDSDQQEQKVVYVGDLPHDVTVSELETMLQKYGQVEDVKIFCKERNYGIVTFKYSRDAAEAVQYAPYDPDLCCFCVNLGESNRATNTGVM